MTVDKNLFVSLLQRYAGTTAEDADLLLALKNSYPYSQLLQTLAAKVSNDHQLPNHQEILQVAAIHAADRSVLKEIISMPFKIGEQQPVQQIEVESVIDEPSTKIEVVKTENFVTVAGTETTAEQVRNNSTPFTSFVAIDGMDVADQVLLDLEKLNTLKHNFEMLFVEYTEVQLPAAESLKEIKAPEKIKESSKSRKERIIQLARSLHANDTTAVDHPAKKKPMKGNPNEELIDEIATNKQEIVPENPRQKEQIEIINQFIKTSPTINNARDRQVPPPIDLNTVKSGEFGDNIVSETLVEILIKQGKKDKAVEVLKKLIWKYPQKKAYFASQIEDLKK
jgi:hypothetical protein